MSIPTVPNAPTLVNYRVYYCNDGYPRLEEHAQHNEAVHNQHGGINWCGDVAVFRLSQVYPGRFVNMRSGDDRRCHTIVQM